jgi:branched-chain amino acid transport system permease protein
METLLNQVLAGLATGAVYACVALALVVIYQATHHVNFAQGEMATFSTFIAWALIQAGFPYWAAFVTTVVLSFVIACAIEYAVIRPLHKAPALSVVVVFIGLMIIFHSLAGWLFGHETKQFPSPFGEKAWFATRLMSAREVGAIVTALVVVALLFVFLRLTPIGLKMRAAAHNPGSARLLGVHVGTMLMLGWGLAGAIGAVAGMMVAPTLFLDPDMMIGVLMYAFAAALLGGIDNPLGAVVGGFLVGVFENLVGAYVLGTELKFIAALMLIVGVLIVRPAGILGRVTVARV